MFYSLSMIPTNASQVFFLFCVPPSLIYPFFSRCHSSIILRSLDLQFISATVEILALDHVLAFPLCWKLHRIRYSMEHYAVDELRNLPNYSTLLCAKRGCWVAEERRRSKLAPGRNCFTVTFWCQVFQLKVEDKFYTSWLIFSIIHCSLI